MTPTQTLIAWFSAGMSIGIVLIVVTLYVIILLSVFAKRDRKDYHDTLALRASQR